MNSSHSVQVLIYSNLKLKFINEDFKKYLDLPNFDEICRHVDFKPKKLTESKTRKHLERIEIIEQNEVAEVFLNR